ASKGGPEKLIDFSEGVNRKPTHRDCQYFTGVAKGVFGDSSPAVSPKRDFRPAAASERKQRRSAALPVFAVQTGVRTAKRPRQRQGSGYMDHGARRCKSFRCDA